MTDLNAPTPHSGIPTVPSTEPIRSINRVQRQMTPNATFRRYAAGFRSTKGMAGLLILALLALLALLAPVLFPGGYDQQSAVSFAAPSFGHPFGTDELGRDLFIRSIYGLRTDFSIVIVAVPLSLLVGTALGLLGGLSLWAGSLVQRILDIILGFPGVVLAICIVLIIGPGWVALVMAITIAGLPTFGRLARAGLLEQNNREYVTAARALGVSKATILRRHILPNAVDPILVSGAMFVVAAVFIESGMSIIGLGIQPPLPSLGSLLNVGSRYIESAPMYILGPTLILILLSMSFSLISDALNETVNRK